MQIEQLWKAMEAGTGEGTQGVGGWVLRLATATPSSSLFVGIDTANTGRAIFLRIPAEILPARKTWPRCKGLESIALSAGSDVYFGVRLKEAKFADVFTALAEDLTRKVADLSSDNERSSAFLAQLGRWQSFLSASTEGLGEEAQRGLWGELHLLRQLVKHVGPGTVAGWRGATAAHQDFQFRHVAAEVKTTIAKQPQSVRITSERQLDHTKWPHLYLAVVALDVWEDAGETLPSIVHQLRAQLSADSSSLDLFDDLLLKGGYLDAHASRYASPGYGVRSLSTFHLGPKFPCLLESNLPEGVGDVNYALSVAACEDFRCESTELVNQIAADLKGEANA